jgi:beta-glucanase (GH16 family)
MPIGHSSELQPLIYLNALSVALQTSSNPTKWFSSTTKGTTLLGSSGADYVGSGGGQSTLAGGAGDDTYWVWHTTNTILELQGGGIDTLVACVSGLVLPNQVENLTLPWANTAGRGNALDNIVTGGDGAQTLDGGAGNDILIGGAGADTFVVRAGNGSDVITDFAPGTDRVRLENYALYSFGAVKAALVQSGADAVLTLGGGEKLVFRNTQASSFGAGDFLLPTDPAHAGLHLTFDDEFNSFSASASGIGSTWKTTYQINNQLRTLSSNKEAEYYSDSSVGVNPFSLINGVLDITAAPGSNPLNLPYTSGLITTAKSFAQQYGFFEVRAQLPAGQGFWPAFWLLPASGSWPPEIDIFEVLGNDPTTGYFSLHTTTGATVSNAVRMLPDLSAGFHTYGLSWQADRIKWYVDGNEVAEAATPADMHQPMYMLLNLAVGGAGSWPGQPDPSLPTAHMLIDYVRVWGTPLRRCRSRLSSPGPAMSPRRAAATACRLAARATSTTSPRRSSASTWMPPPSPPRSPIRSGAAASPMRSGPAMGH